MPANFKTLIIGICLSFLKYLSYGLSAIRHKKRVSINQNIRSRYFTFPSYPSSTNPRSPEKQFEFKIDDYHLLRENNKKRIGRKKKNFTANDIDHLTYSIHHNVIATENSCLFDKFNNPINESVLWRIQANGEPKFPYGKLEPISANKKPALKLNSAVWIRFAHFYHFGHLLTETCSALYPLVLWKKAGLDIENVNIVLHKTYKKSFDSIKELFSVTGKNIYFHGPHCEYDLKIKRLLIPRPTIVLRGFSSRKHALVTQQFLDLWAPIERQNSQDTEWSNKGSSMPFNFKNRLLYLHSKKHPKYSKLWLSRTQFNKCSRALPEERQIEKNLSEMGWKIIHPQQHSIRTQLNALEEARVVAGLAGSAFHLLYGVKDKKKIIQLTWRDNGCTFDKQFKSQGFDYHLIQCLKLHKGSTKLGNGYDINKIIELISILSQ
tara:strand:- start:310 stop:1614 length:1305 start_codon:yes stop_codon:yes gene_type:complete